MHVVADQAIVGLLTFLPHHWSITQLPATSITPHALKKSRYIDKPLSHSYQCTIVA